MRSYGFRTIGNNRQGGATAIEFAFVLPIMLVLFYGALTYGLIFLMRLGLQHAAESGARAAQRYPLQSCAQAMGAPCDPEDRQQHQFNERLKAAFGVATAQASWMLRDGSTALQVVARICPDGAECTDATSASCDQQACPAVAPPDCGASACQIVVTVRYDYAAAPFVPRLPGLGLVTPDELTGQGRLLIDARGFTL
ncbi:TadE-like protein [Sinimarinibacterium flocculans]|uniref:TadE-like protein n=2 Tax=Sinimarinibacterium flocculans TaxID=985250 RepID=A0A318E0J1_9GAMM|nr:TadE family protein [Sinimarinibacterium flocculans]PXV64214.1 TadE-like protein [Sinimarinibacterium flocculans]